MHFVSTRGGVPKTTLSKAIGEGAAPDGGLFVPWQLPRLALSGNPRSNSPAESARAVLGPFFEGDALEGQLEALCSEAFDCKLPLVPLNGPGDMVLELFHGPTAAFKDFGARFLAACFRRMGSQPLTVLVATSGDTGSAVAAALHRAPGVHVVLLYPDGRVSPRQAHQLGCFGDNVTALRVAGTFDDCQRMVKAAFAEPELRRRLRLTSANSINLGRLLPQMAFHAHAAWTHGGPLNLIIPTGNLGDGVAALWAREAGVPIGDIVLSTNANRVLADFFEGGGFRPRPSLPTLASAMDVGSPSNFERLRWSFPDEAALTSRLTAIAVDDSAIQQTIQLGERRHGQVFCPHTATAVRVLEGLRAAGDRRPWAVVATAHPAKFETVVEPLVGHRVPIPASLAALLARGAHAEPLEAEPSALLAWLLSRARG